MKNKIIKNGLVVVGCAASSAFFWLPPWLGAIIGFFLGMCPEFLIQDILPNYASSDNRIISESLAATFIGLTITIALIHFGIHVGFFLTVIINILSNKLAGLIKRLCV